MQVLTGNKIQLFRLKMLLTAMKLELETGMRMTSRHKSPSPFTIAKREFNIAGKPKNIYVYQYVLQQYQAMVEQAKAQEATAGVQ